MTRLVRIEWLKLRTMRVGFGLLATSVALTALFASLEASRMADSNSVSAFTRRMPLPPPPAEAFRRTG